MMGDFEKFKKAMLISTIAGATLFANSKEAKGQEAISKLQYKTESLDKDSLLEGKCQYAEKVMQDYMNSLDFLYSATKDDTVKNLHAFLEKHLVPVGSKGFDKDQQIYFIPAYEDDNDVPGIAMAFGRMSEKAKKLHANIHPGSYYFVENFPEDARFIEEFSKDFSQLPSASLLKGLVFYHESLHALFEESRDIVGQGRPEGHDEIGKAEHEKIHSMIFGLVSRLVGENELKNILEQEKTRALQTQKIIAALQEKGVISLIEDSEIDLWVKLLEDNFPDLE